MINSLTLKKSSFDPPLEENKAIDQIDPNIKGLKKLSLSEQKQLKGILGLSNERSQDKSDKSKNAQNDDQSNLTSKFDNELEQQHFDFWQRRLKHSKILSMFTNTSNVMFQLSALLRPHNDIHFKVNCFYIHWNFSVMKR